MTKTLLHWHGDTFDLPEGAMHLASTPDCDNQAFSFGRNALALQFHSEAYGFERWLIGHACEIAAARISIPALRDGMAGHGAKTAEQGRVLLSNWLMQLA